MSGTGVPEPEVLEPCAPAPGSVDPTPPGRGISREAGRRIALFALVLVVAAGGAWGAGRMLGASLGPAAVQGHDMSGHDMSGMDMSDMDMSDMPGMDMTEQPG